MKKIYYFPGLISAVIIPILFWYYGNQKFEDINVSVIDIGLPAKERKGTKNTFASFEPARNWNYKKIKIDPGTAREHSKLYVSELKNLQKRNEKESGIEFILDKNNSYGDFVSVLNDLAIAKQNSMQLILRRQDIFLLFTAILILTTNVGFVMTLYILDQQKLWIFLDLLSMGKFLIYLLRLLKKWLTLFSGFSYF
ncbi:hypothetical protein [Chryseobacterium sp. JK1]|uniref:hypothetical protein n=1 Tax=Chryseobacterium sp. JK1 TaxID=874294 RepID=UPI003D68A792